MNPNIQERLSELPQFLGSHIQLTLFALAAAVLVSVPLALFLVKRPKIKAPVLLVVGVLQTIPGLALLAMMVPLLAATNGFGLGLSSFGFWPALIALTIYALLPILRNSVAGLEGVNSKIVEAATAMGMTPWQTNTKIELPLAAPVIFAGIRTASVWTVGTATLATPVGQMCLGNYIFSGLQTQNWVMIMFGVVSAASLAVLMDGLWALLANENEEHKSARGWLSSFGLLGIVLVAIFLPRLRLDVGGETDVNAKSEYTNESLDSDATAKDVIVIGSKTFSEQFILAEVMEKRLVNQGLKVEQKSNLGSALVFKALVSGEIDVLVDYSGTLWTNVMKRKDVLPAWKTNAVLATWLAEEKDVRLLGNLGFENAYSLAIRKEDAESKSLRTISDLVKVGPEFRGGGDYEFFSRPEWKAIERVYGLNLKSKNPFDPSFMYDAAKRKEVDVISAYTSDGRIESYGLVVLKDDLGAIQPYDAMILLNKSVANDKRVVDALMPLVDKISIEMMRQANHMVDRPEDSKTATEAAMWMLENIQP